MTKLKTTEDLKAAFAGESQANRRYLAFAKKAEEEGRPGLARLFRAAAESETVHALNDLWVLEAVKTSEENIKEAIKGETYEIETMYPGFIEDAKSEGEDKALMVFGGSKKVEEVHQRMLKEALAKVEAGGDAETAEYYICSVCGNVEKGGAPDNCPICNAPKEKFYRL
jgi:rubrerythrin